MPRRTASRARSLALQWLIGTPTSSGRSHANATMAQICSGMIVAGAPERGASCKRSATVSPAPPASQRARHMLTPLRHTPSRCAVSHNAGAIGRQHDHPCPKRQLLGCRTAAGQAVQFAALLGAEREGVQIGATWRPPQAANQPK